jgi:hypothetical protein
MDYTEEVSRSYPPNATVDFIDRNLNDLADLGIHHVREEKSRNRFKLLGIGGSLGSSWTSDLSKLFAKCNLEHGCHHLCSLQLKANSGQKHRHFLDAESVVFIAMIFRLSSSAYEQDPVPCF